MARHEHDREDILAEATALVERAALTLHVYREAVVAGFRRDNSVSFYFGAEPVYQFTSAGALRRAYVDGRIYKAEQGRLVELERRRSASAVELVRHELTDGQRQAFQASMHGHMKALRDALAAGACECTGQVPPDADVVTRIASWLERYGTTTEIAKSPRAG